MKILVFEYITGGGFNKQELPDSLASEGRLMLQALLDNLRSHAEHGHENDIDVLVMLDSRINGSINTGGFDTVIIKPEQNSHDEFARLALLCDAVWPIAPEFDGILQTLCQTVELLGKRLLTSPARAVAVTGNKFNTYQHLKRHHIATVPTRMFTGTDGDMLNTGSFCGFCPPLPSGEGCGEGFQQGANRDLPQLSNSDTQELPQEFVNLSSASPLGKARQWLVKLVDGVGCTDSYILTDQHDFEQMRLRKGRYVIQPHVEGKKTSLSCLFNDGSGWLVCANLQHFNIINRQYQLSKIIVNFHADLNVYQNLVDTIARALPELWGYAGIDLIETLEQLFVLEINPRLTTSFVGINAALGINVAENILQLLEGKPTLKAVCNQSITINVKQNDSD
jgi:predicted ATP-grasp superfamily ATP-dependent carboligase